MAPSVFMRSQSSACLCHMYLISCTALTLSHKGYICVVLEKHTWQHLADHIPSPSALLCPGSSLLRCCSHGFFKMLGINHLFSLLRCWAVSAGTGVPQGRTPMQLSACKLAPMSCCFSKSRAWAWKPRQVNSRNLSNNQSCVNFGWCCSISVYFPSVTFACHYLFGCGTLAFTSSSRREAEEREWGYYTRALAFAYVILYPLTSLATVFLFLNQNKKWD